MTIETATYLNQLNPSYPENSDFMKEGDDHIRLIKGVLKTTFTNIDKQVLASSELLNELIDYKSYIDDKFETMYPKGSIYTSVVGTEPSSFLGFGVWKPIGEGRVLVGAGTNKDTNNQEVTFTAGEKAGVYSHTLKDSELPKHGHTATANSTNLGSRTSNNAGSHRHRYMMDDNTGQSASAIGNLVGGMLNPGQGASGRGSLLWYQTDAQGDHSHQVTLGAHTHSITISDSNGKGLPHTNIQPYLTVYMWERTE